MTQKFSPGKPIVIWTKITGPHGTRTVRLLLDTGAVISMIRVDRLIAVGALIDPAKTMLITSASDVQSMPMASIPLVQVAEHQREDFSVIAHDLPGLANLDGLLGIDFLSDLHISIRMQRGFLRLEKDFLDGSST